MVLRFGGAMTAISGHLLITTLIICIPWSLVAQQFDRSTILLDTMAIPSAVSPNNALPNSLNCAIIKTKKRREFL